ncbi:hypothetical protein [Consotaella salsifontis]|uniref:Uncharacterized protein n=1 Tax=Consotaella salsifontis TaxID=1365950 RepID=A0A1T4PW18_9HYPH|nr:hypothetical protein [Consotaella salsifontis]SJZ95713.1 hypothetical protein SAMN05428963_104197 [Consotaella salsifontis]
MPKTFPEQRDPITTHRSPYANEADARPEEAADLANADAEEPRDQADREPGTLAGDEAVTQDIATQPASDETDQAYGAGYDETDDGLSDIEESVRRAAEDMPLRGSTEDR